MASSSRSRLSVSDRSICAKRVSMSLLTVANCATWTGLSLRQLAERFEILRDLDAGIEHRD